MSLTKHPEGSLRELWSIAFPLMLSSFSLMLMLFIDRLLLAHYSTAALNAAVNATTLGWAFVFGWVILASIGEVFVAQYNGAGQKEKLGEPIWQMIWLSLGSLLFFIPLAIWGSTWFFGEGADKEMERKYFRLMMMFGPSFPLYSALCGFFVGQGKIHLITVLAVLANIVNALLDIVLIFGIEGWIPSLGIEGAAIATSGCTIFQAIVLGIIFLKKFNRDNFGTSDYPFKLQPFLQCIKIGMPGALFVIIEILGWATFYWMMTLTGERYITVAGICQSVAILFYFFAEGISKAATTISGNLIGSQRIFFIPNVLRSGFYLHLLFFAAATTIIFFSSDLLIEQFLPSADSEIIASMHDTLLISLYAIVTYLLFEGIRLLFSGILTAAGDTFFLLIAGSLSVWVLLVLPVYWVIVLKRAEVEIAMFICVFYSIGASLLYFWRFKEGKWKMKSILGPQ